MNKVYRSVWSAARQAYVVASENTRSKDKPSKASAAVGVAALALVGLSQPAVASCNVVAASTTACELGAGEDATISTAGSITINSSALVGGAVTVLPTEAAGFITNDGTLAASDGKAGVLLETDASSGLLTNRGTISATGGGSDGVRVGSGATLTELSNGPGIGAFGQGMAGNITSSAGGAIVSNGTITTLNNNGLIQGATGGLVLGSGARVTTLNNNAGGRIIATGDLNPAINMFADARIVTLNNAGVIEAEGTGSAGLNMRDDTSINTLTNSGTIKGDLAGVYLEGSVGNDPRITTFRNSGTIEGGTYSVHSTTQFGIQIIDIQGNNTARFIGQVNAPNTKMVVNPGATYTLRSTDDFRTLGFENRGTVQFDSTTLSFDATHIADGFRNYGVMSLAAGQLATLTGDFLQFNDATLGNGVIRINVTDNNSYGQLNVYGDITLPSNARFDVNVADPNFQFTLSPLFGVVNAVGGSGTLTWDETHITTDNSVLFDFIPMIDWAASSNSIMLEIVAASNNGGGAGNAVSTTGNRVAAGAAAVIDDLSAAFAGGGTGNADMDSFIGSLGTLTTDAQLAAAVESTLPVLQGAAPRVNLNTQVNMAQAIQGRQQATLGLSAGDAFVDQHLWVKPFGSWGDQKNRNGAQGYDSETYGVMVGMDAEVRPDYRLGVSLGYANSQADSNNGLNSLDVDSYLVSVYGSAQVTDATSINWQAGYSHHNNEGSRRILVVDSVAKADYSSQGWHAGIGVDHAIALSESVTFIPSVTLDYDRIRDKAYRETGAGALNLSVDRNNTEQLILGVNSRLQFELTETSSLQADLGVGHDFNAKQNSITSAYVGGGNAFTTQGIEPSKSLWRAGLGYVNQTANGTEIGARADVQQRNSGQQDASASLTLRWAF